MGLKLKRNKPRNLKLSLAYQFKKYLPISSKKKLKLFLDLAWIFSRLAHEQIFTTKLDKKYDPKTDFLVKHLPDDAKVLDIGCGSGYVIKRMLPKTKHIVGVDYDQAAINNAQKLFEENTIRLICDDVFNFLQQESDQFDLIVLSHVLEHINNPGDFLKKLADKSKYFYIEVPDFEVSHLNLYRVLVETDLVYTDADHVSEFDRSELLGLIEEARLEVVDAEFKMGVIKFWCKSTI